MVLFTTTTALVRFVNNVGRNMNSPARKRLQIPFSQVAIGKKFQLVNSVMQAAIPGSQIFKKIDAIRGDNGTQQYAIRPDWPTEEVIEENGHVQDP